MAMKTCPMCGANKLRASTSKQTLVVSGRTFVADVPVMRCGACEEEMLDGPALGRFELLAAAELAKAGASTGEAFKFMRKALGMRAADLGQLLGVAAETISRWETGKRGVDRPALAMLASLVVERTHGGSDVMDVLRALDTPKRAARGQTAIALG